MNSIVLTTANSKTSEPHKYSYRLADAMHLDDHYICLSNLSLYYTWKNIRASHMNNMFQYYISGKRVDVILPDGSYSIKDINNYMHMIMISNHDGTDKDYPISIYANRTSNRVSVVVKPSCGLVLTEGMAHVLGFSNLTITNTSNGDLVPQLERVDTVLVHCNLAWNNFTEDSSLIFSFVPDKTFGTQLHQKPNFPLWRQTRNTSGVKKN